ncbi:MAG: hypothetical protein LBQ24_02485 [Candidatus Peribacteria bacterium]|jgi:predicted  nucleic acid-binding Zn-ribbon protein|nr:hypothetical protein [Candidatus Peribacteria bacterium]
MYDFNTDIETEARKLDDKIKKLQEERARIEEQLQSEKKELDLAKKVGLLVVKEFQGKEFKYSELKALLDSNLISDYDRKFFGLAELAVDDPRKPKKRGRRKATPTEE